MTARQGTGPCQFGHFQGGAEVVEDQLLDQGFTPGAKAPRGFFLRLNCAHLDRDLLNESHGQCPCRWARAGALHGGSARFLV